MARRCCLYPARRWAPSSTSLDIPELDIFDGIVIGTHHGLRFIGADQVELITRSGSAEPVFRTLPSRQIRAMAIADDQGADAVPRDR
ncbi:MAG TPA: hypothetical protein VME44_00045 [Streptosporangiaceae bacterium]|nr:hypothetical protein [Streptosporangiaceae bacterium]